MNCRKAPIGFQADANDLRPHLPPGFEPVGLVVDELPDVNLNVFQCEGIVEDNQTVLGPVSFAATLAHVRVNGTLETGSSSQWYLFEFFADNQRLVDLFAQVGLPSYLAQIELEFAAPQTRASVSVDGALWYEAVGTHRAQEQVTLNAQFRWFNVPQDAPVVWAQVNETYQFKTFLDAIALSANSGFLSGLKPAPDAPIEALTQELSATGRISFGHL